MAKSTVKAKAKAKKPVLSEKEKLKLAKEREKKKLKKEADVVIKELQATGVRQYLIAIKMKVSEFSLSRFMQQKDDYITRTMIDKAKAYLESLTSVVDK